MNNENESVINNLPTNKAQGWVDLQLNLPNIQRRADTNSAEMIQKN